ncbi:tyrosine-type recombinase/integrase [Leptospira weilii]|uniref:tyrosine-type recombinase/integrase n=1 Tax=Leptospira weilii TaxID=28184 RepID=UPI0002D31716|nr:tyrosine-type recombinase/integrase [Leptospira weilii]OMI16993.1 recombinase XerC [Leptospira weilii serovar Heyan]ULH27418.1 tyrosine-type recombinase/integrase [Leptospira weilii]UPY77595.1 tyrosine-type recombinase/integrase [Leptospira weilii]
MKQNTAKVIEIEAIRIQSKRKSSKASSEHTAFYKGFTDEVMRELFDRFSKPITEEDYRNRALFILISKTGLRAKEVISLRFTNLLKGPSGEILIQYVKKGGKKGFSVLSEEILSIIRAYHEVSNIVSDNFFLSRPKRHQKQRTQLTTRSLQRIINSWNVTTCQGRKAHPHAIRHTVGQKLLETVGSIAAQKVLGHSNPNTTSKFYTKPYFDGSSYLKWD